MIEKLTKKQEAKLKVYRGKWLKIGLSTKTNRKLAEKAIDDVYKVAGLEKPKIKIWLASPYEGAVGAALLAGTKVAGAQVWAQVRAQVWDQVGAQVGDQVRAQVGAQVWAQVRAQVRDQVGDQVGAQVWAQVGAQVGAQVWAQVRAQVRDQVGAQVGAQVWAQVGDQVGAQVGDQVGAQVGAQVGDQVYRCAYGLHDAEWLGFYEFFLNECKIKEAKKLLPLMKLAESAGWCWPFQGAVILTEKPVEIHRNERNQLHSDHGPALRYADGFCLYRLNGIRVSKEVAETPKDKITKEMITKETNADIRREIIRKVGGEQLLKILDYKILDSFDEYELISFEIGDGRVRPFLKMRCPSTKLTHIEGVRPEITSVKAALAYKFKVKEWKRPQFEA